MTIRIDQSDSDGRCYRGDHKWAREILNARRRADDKHGINSIEKIPPDAPGWLAILTEEVGELAHELTYDAAGGTARLRAELIDVLAVASAWLDAIDETEQPVPFLPVGLHR